MPLTLSQLGKKVKAKYPVYANIPDEQLAQKVIKKYPVYASQVSSGPSPQDIAKRRAMFDVTASGPMSQGMGPTLKDVPHVAAKIGSGALLGVPEMVAKNPIAGPMEMGAKFLNPQVVPQEPKIFPEAATPEGKRVGNLLGAAAGLASPIPLEFSKEIPAIKESIGDVANPRSFAKNVRSSMFDLRSKLGKAIDPQITALSEANPGKTIDLSDHFDYIKSAVEDKENIGLKQDINGILRKIKDPQTSKLLQGLIKNPENASELTLKQAEDIKRAVSQSPTIAAKMKQGKFANWTPGDREMIDLLDNIKASQSEVFPELSKIRKPYAEYMDAYNKVKGKFREGSLIKNLKGKFGDEEIEPLAQKVLPPDVWKKIQGFRKTRNLGKTVGLGAGAVAGGALATGLGKRLLQQIFGN